MTTNPAKPDQARRRAGAGAALGEIMTTLHYGWHLGVVLLLLWIGLTGGQNWLAGCAIAAVTVLISRTLMPMEQPHFSIPGLMRFLGYFLVTSLTGGMDIARRAFDPSLPLEITNWKHRFQLPAGQPRTVLVATISLLPGTLSRGLGEDWVLVNSIAGDRRRDIEKLERIIAGMFREKPDD